jgi:hypothetical protein
MSEPVEAAIEIAPLFMPLFISSSTGLSLAMKAATASLENELRVLATWRCRGRSSGGPGNTQKVRLGRLVLFGARQSVVHAKVSSTALRRCVGFVRSVSCRRPLVVAAGNASQVAMHKPKDTRAVAKAKAKIRPLQKSFVGGEKFRATGREIHPTVPGGEIHPTIISRVRVRLHD